MAIGTFDNCIPTGAEIRTSSQKGTPYIHMWWRVDTGSGTVTATADLWLTENVSPKTGQTQLQRTMKTLVDIGWDPRRDPSELHGADERDMKLFFPDGAQLVLEEEQGNDGRTYTKVKWINRKRAAGEVSKAAVQAGDPLAAITARMRAAALMAAPAKTEEFADATPGDLMAKGNAADRLLAQAQSSQPRYPSEPDPDESEFGEPLGANALDFP